MDGGPEAVRSSPQVDYFPPNSAWPVPVNATEYVVLLPSVFSNGRLKDVRQAPTHLQVQRFYRLSYSYQHIRWGAIAALQLASLPLKPIISLVLVTDFAILSLIARISQRSARDATKHPLRQLKRKVAGIEIEHLVLGAKNIYPENKADQSLCLTDKRVYLPSFLVWVLSQSCSVCIMISWLNSSLELPTLALPHTSMENQPTHPASS